MAYNSASLYNGTLSIFGSLLYRNGNIGTSGITSPDTILSVLNNIETATTQRVMLEIGSATTDSGNLGSIYKYALGYSNSSSFTDGKFIIQGCPVSTSTYTNTDPPVTLLQLSKTNLGLSVPIQFQVNTWNTSSDGKARFFFSSGNRTHFGSPNGYSFRNETDAFDVVVIDTIGNILIGSNTSTAASNAFPTPPIPKIYSGTDNFNGRGDLYHTALSLALEAQSIVDPGGKAYGASIVLEGGREAPITPGWRVDGAIKFITGGSEKLRLTNDGLYIFSGNVPIRLQTRYNEAAPFDCMFEINTNYNRVTNTVDGAPYGTASLQVNTNQVEGGYISMATGGKNIAPTEVVRVTGSNMNVAGNITVTGGILSGNGSGLTNLPGASHTILTTPGSSTIIAKSNAAYIILIGAGGNGGNGSSTGPNATGQGGGGGGSGYILQGLYTFSKGDTVTCFIAAGGSEGDTGIYVNSFFSDWVTNLKVAGGKNGSRGGDSGTGSGIGVGGNGYCGGGGGGGTNSYGSSGGTGFIAGLTNGTSGSNDTGSGGSGGYNPLIGAKFISNGAPPQATFPNSQYAGGGGGGHAYPGFAIGGSGGYYNRANDSFRNGTVGGYGCGGGGGCSGSGRGGTGGNGYIQFVWL